MMKSAENWPRGEVTASLDGPLVRRILVQRQMRSELVVISCVGRKYPTQMGVAKDDVWVAFEGIAATDFHVGADSVAARRARKK